MPEEEPAEPAPKREAEEPLEGTEQAPEETTAPEAAEQPEQQQPGQEQEQQIRERAPITQVINQLRYGRQMKQTAKTIADLQKQKKKQQKKVKQERKKIKPLTNKRDRAQQLFRILVPVCIVLLVFALIFAVTIVLIEIAGILFSAAWAVGRYALTLKARILKMNIELVPIEHKAKKEEKESQKINAKLKKQVHYYRRLRNASLIGKQPTQSA